MAKYCPKLEGKCLIKLVWCPLDGPRVRVCLLRRTSPASELRSLAPANGPSPHREAPVGRRSAATQNSVRVSPGTRSASSRPPSHGTLCGPRGRGWQIGHVTECEISQLRTKLNEMFYDGVKWSKELVFVYPTEWNATWWSSMVFRASLSIICLKMGQKEGRKSDRASLRFLPQVQL